MIEFFTLYTTPLLIGVLEEVSTHSPYMVLGTWLYFLLKTFLGSVSICFENANKARNIHRTMICVLCVCDLVALSTLAAFYMFDLWNFAILVGMDLASYTIGVLPYFRRCSCQQFFCLSQPKWQNAFRLEEPDGKMPPKALFVVDVVWLCVLDLTITYLFLDLTCLDATYMFDLFFWGMMVCWTWTSLLWIQIMGALAPFRSHQTIEQVNSIMESMETLMEVRYVDRSNTCRLTRIYAMFTFLFTLFLSILIFHFSWNSLGMFNTMNTTSCTNFSAIPPDPTQIFPYVGQIDAWATTNIFTIILMIPSVVLCMVNLSTLCVTMCK